MIYIKPYLIIHTILQPIPTHRSSCRPPQQVVWAIAYSPKNSAFMVSLKTFTVRR